MTALADEILGQWLAGDALALNRGLADPESWLGALVERTVHWHEVDFRGNDDDPPREAFAVWACWPFERVPVYDRQAFGQRVREPGTNSLENFRLLAPGMDESGGPATRLVPHEGRCDHCRRAWADSDDTIAVVPVSTGSLVVLVALCNVCVSDLAPTTVVVIERN